MQTAAEYSESVSEPNYMDQITRMLVEESDNDDNDSDVVDDSDAEPGLVLLNERHNSDESYSDLEKKPIIMGEPQLILQDSVVQPVEAEKVRPSPNWLSSHVFGRLQKNEYGPVYCWSTKELFELQHIMWSEVSQALLHTLDHWVIGLILELFGSCLM